MSVECIPFKFEIWLPWKERQHWNRQWIWLTCRKSQNETGKKKLNEQQTLGAMHFIFIQLLRCLFDKFVSTNIGEIVFQRFSDADHASCNNRYSFLFFSFSLPIEIEPSQKKNCIKYLKHYAFWWFSHVQSTRISHMHMIEYRAVWAVCNLNDRTVGNRIKTKSNSLQRQSMCWSSFIHLHSLPMKAINVAHRMQIYGRFSNYWAHHLCPKVIVNSHCHSLPATRNLRFGSVCAQVCVCVCDIFAEHVWFSSEWA